MASPPEKSIFLQAIEFDTPELRANFLNDVCRNDAQLRASVEALLCAHGMPENPLDRPALRRGDRVAGAPDVTVDQGTEQIGVTIDRYRLMEKIGEGGFGLVFVARQEKPVRRDVALKIIKPGMGSKDVIARFEAERQALALMDHPNIARVFDAGVYIQGGEASTVSELTSQRPYFVMELVRGVPITDCCDAKRLDTRQRLELFETVCTAVHHAHQKGVIHRDIKPSNVLVTMHDAKPVAKVIDFGIAKAIGTRLTEKTIYTQFHWMIGTPLYMSPEQAEMGGLDIDTRSDIYSLGVLLYELLTGTTPIDRQRLDTASFDELRRIIREEEAPRPSDRLTMLGDRLTTISSARCINPGRLAGTLRGDLDWIVLKAMEKDRRRRYESAASLAADVRNFLTDQAVQARPPSPTYLIQKFARRNRVALLTGGLVAAAMILGTAASLWQMSNAIGERNDKDAALREALIAKEEANTARREVERFADRLKQANVLMVDADANAAEGQHAGAISLYSQAVSLQPNYFLTRQQRGQMYLRLNLWDLAADDFVQALRMGAPPAGPNSDHLPHLFWLTGRDQAYRDLIESTLANASHENPPTWDQIRAALIAETEGPSFQQLRQFALAKRDQSGDATHVFLDFFRGRGGGPPRDRDRAYGPRRSDGPRPAGDRAWERPLPPAGQDYVVSWAEMRSGQIESAIKRLAQSQSDRGWRGNDLTWPLLAVAHHAAGQEAAALESLAKSASAVDRLLDQYGGASNDAGGQGTSRPPLASPWIDQAELLILHRQALTATRQSTADLDLRIESVQRMAADRLIP